MRSATPTITIPVELANPGQFFACCGFLELASRIDEHAEAWFTNREFNIASTVPFGDVLARLRQSRVKSTMTPKQTARTEEVSEVMQTQAKSVSDAEEVTKEPKSLRRESPLVLTGWTPLLIDWFTDQLAGGSRFKTWAGRQTVLDIARAMHAGLSAAGVNDESTLWNHARRIGLPFNFDSDLGAQGSPLDVGFSFDPLEGHCEHADRREEQAGSGTPGIHRPATLPPA